MVNPTRRYSYWVFLLIGALAGISTVLPSLKGEMPGWLYVVLVIAGVVCQHIKQKAPNNDDENSTGG